MKETVALAKAVDAKKEFLPTMSEKNIQGLPNKPERQLGSLRGVIDNIRRDGGTPSVESIATELSGIHAAQRTSVLLALQRTHGNRYVQRVVSMIQAKLVVGQTGDKYEQEADQVADAVMRMPEPAAMSLNIQWQDVEEEERKKKKEKLIMAKGLSIKAPEVSDDLYARLNLSRGSEQPLPMETRTFMEERFGVDFSAVRIHADSGSVKMAKALNAKAFTYGRDIYFGVGLYRPQMAEGKRLIAHELTHVVQQSGGRTTVPEIQLNEDAIRRELHPMSDPERETDPRRRAELLRALEQRRERLRRAFRSVEPEEAEGLFSILDRRQEGDELSKLFHDTLASATRAEMLRILEDRFPTRIQMPEEELRRVRTIPIQDFIVLVRRVESRYRERPLDIVKRLRNTVKGGEYARGIFRQYLGEYPSITPGGSLTPVDVGLLRGLYNVSTAQGTLDIGHVLTGIEAKVRASMPGRGGLTTRLPIREPDPGPALTWAGDVGSALAHWILRDRPVHSRWDQYYDEEYASEDDLLADIDAIALSARAPRSVFITRQIRGGALSDILEGYYITGAQTGVSQRFTNFCSASGFGSTVHDNKLTDAAISDIKEQIRNFAWWFLRHRQLDEPASPTSIPDDDLNNFSNKFVRFVEGGLAQENP